MRVLHRPIPRQAEALLSKYTSLAPGCLWPTFNSRRHTRAFPSALPVVL